MMAVVEIVYLPGSCLASGLYNTMYNAKFCFPTYVSPAGLMALADSETTAMRHLGQRRVHRLWSPG